MNPNNFSFKYTFEDGERVVSTMEFDFSTYIRSLGYEYNKSYFRDVMYKTFTNSDKKRKTNCDYCIFLPNEEKLYVEIAGVLHNNTVDWRHYEYKYKCHQEYQRKMLYKEKVLVENKCNYLFLFSSEMKNEIYKEILQNKINEILQKAD